MRHVISFAKSLLGSIKAEIQENISYALATLDWLYRHVLYYNGRGSRPVLSEGYCTAEVLTVEDPNHWCFRSMSCIQMCEFPEERMEP